MADVEFDTDYNKKISLAKCPEKSSAVLTISPAPGGFIFYSISADVGKVAKELSGRFTSIEKAQKAIESYYHSSVQTQAAQVKEVEARIKKRKAEENATKSSPKDSKHVHKGSDN